MDNIPHICPIRDRRYQEVPIDQVKVINSRNRDKEQFEMNVESIDNIGLLNAPPYERSAKKTQCEKHKYEISDLRRDDCISRCLGSDSCELGSARVGQ